MQEFPPPPRTLTPPLNRPRCLSLRRCRRLSRWLLSGRKADPETDLDTLAKRRFDADDSRPNGSSIAVLAEYGGMRVLLAADAYADVLAQALQALRPPAAD